MFLFQQKDIHILSSDASICTNYTYFSTNYKYLGKIYDCQLGLYNYISVAGKWRKTIDLMIDLNKFKAYPCFYLFQSDSESQ